MSSRLSDLLRVRFVRDVLTLQIGRTIAIGCGLVTSIAYVRLLGLEGYGTYAVIMAFAGVFGIITNLGQQSTLLTFLSDSYGAKDRTAMREISQYYIAVCVIVASFLLVLTAIAPTIADYLYSDTSIGELARLVFISSIFEFVFSYTAISLQVTREIKTLTLLENLKVLLTVLLAITLLLLGHGIEGILISSLTISVSFCLLSLFLYPTIRKRHDLPLFKESLRGVNWSRIQKYGKDGLWIAVDKNIGNLYPTVFLFALSLQAPKPIVGLLRLAFKLADLPASFALVSISRLASSVIPTLAGQGAKMLRPTIGKLAKNSIKLHAAITLCGMILVPIFLPYVYGESMRVAVYPFLIIAVFHLSYAVHAMITPLFRLHSKTYIPASINSIGMIIALLLFFVLEQQLQPTRALYVSLFTYHLISLSAVKPASKLLSLPKHVEQ